METYVNTISSYFMSSYEFKGWLVLIFAFFALYGFICLLKSIFKSKSKKEYIEDEIYDVIWRWKYNKDKIIKLRAYCPTCEDMLVYDDSPCRGPNKHTLFICEHCDQTKATIRGGDNIYAQNIVKREINRRIRVQEKENLTN